MVRMGFLGKRAFAQKPMPLCQQSDIARVGAVEAVKFSVKGIADNPFPIAGCIAMPVTTAARLAMVRRFTRANIYGYKPGAMLSQAVNMPHQMKHDMVRPHKDLMGNPVIICFLVKWLVFDAPVFIDRQVPHSLRGVATRFPAIHDFTTNVRVRLQMPDAERYFEKFCHFAVFKIDAENGG